MGRPAKSAAVQSGNLPEEERLLREEVERRLRGMKDKIKPLAYLSSAQKKIFRFIVGEMAAADVLGNLDVYVLSTCAIAIERLQFIEGQVNKAETDKERKALLGASALMNAKDKYTRDLFRCCNELCLSPQARAKIGSLDLQKRRTNQSPLLNALRGEGDDDDDED